MSDPGYEYDVFISYTRRWACGQWVQTHFKEALERHLKEWREEYSIFLDVETETPALPWPPRLARALARSRVFVPLLNARYFYSDWCRLEWTIACEREKEFYDISSGRSTIILPIRIHDGDEYESELRVLSHLSKPWDLTDYFCLLAKGSVKESELDEHVKKFAESLHKAIQLSPAFHPDWEKECQAATQRQFEARRERVQPVTRF